MVRQWADKQPARYRLSALAFGYPCNRQTHTVEGTLAWIAKHSRKRTGEGVSRATLVRHLPTFVAYGVITVERRRDNDKNKSSVYHVDFSRVIEVEDMGKRQRRRERAAQRGSDNMSLPSEDAERQAWLASLDIDPPEDAVHTSVDRLPDCPACKPSIGRIADAEVVRIHFESLQVIPP
jgi:hypothetical protein